MGWRRGMDGRLAGWVREGWRETARSGRAASSGRGRVGGGGGVDPRDVEPAVLDDVAKRRRGGHRGVEAHVRAFFVQGHGDCESGWDRGVTVRMGRGSVSARDVDGTLRGKTTRSRQKGSRLRRAPSTTPDAPFSAADTAPVHDPHTIPSIRRTASEVTVIASPSAPPRTRRCRHAPTKIPG